MNTNTNTNSDTHTSNPGLDTGNAGTGTGDISNAASAAVGGGWGGDPSQLRSFRWFGAEGLRTFSHQARARQLGLLPQEHLGKPVIAILNTWSDINPCHQHLRERAEAVKRGVWQAGGFPLEFPVATLSETYQKPTPMLYRNLLAMECEEILRSYPVDGAVLMGGCDKTTPALLMGAVSADLPALFVPAGPMLRGHWRGRTLGSGTDMWKYWDEHRAGRLDDAALAELQAGLARSPGTCMTMGTASTMTAAAEAMGVTMPGASAVPAVDSAHTRMCAAAGIHAVSLVRDNLRIRQLITREAIEDAITTVIALGGSTNAVIHLTALARRCQIPLTLHDFDRISRTTPVLADLQPGGRYLMEDFYYAGGLPALLARLAQAGLLHTRRRTATHPTLADQLTGATSHNDDVIRPLDNPLSPEGGLAVLHGNLAPDGAVIKHLAADPALHTHTGPAHVFDDYATMQATINDPALGLTKDHVLILRGAGPLGGPGMPEYGMLPIPDYLLRQGVTDMVRLSDARMSGTSYGTCVLHIAPESHIGGPLAHIRTGDLITLDIPHRTLTHHIDPTELDHRKTTWTPPPPPYQRGYGHLYQHHITQADTGCDFTFLAQPGHNPEPHAG